MKCKNCGFNNIKYPFGHCPICQTAVEWRKKDIVLNVLGRIVLSAGVAFITTVFMRLFLK